MSIDTTEYNIINM